MKVKIKKPLKMRVKINTSSGGTIPVINEIDGNEPFAPINGLLNAGTE